MEEFADAWVKRDGFVRRRRERNLQLSQREVDVWPRLADVPERRHVVEYVANVQVGYFIGRS